MKTLSLLGSTGSIGKNVLAVVRQFPGRFRIVGLSAGRNIALLAEQVLEFQPDCVSVADGTLVEALAERLPSAYRARIVSGAEGNCLVAALPSAQMLVSAVVGAVGLLPTLAAIEAGKDIGLANKETLVMAGSLVMARGPETRGQPVAHRQRAQCDFSGPGGRAPGGCRPDHSHRLGRTVSATGDAEELRGVTPAQALAHPNWDMGRKISIDSATLMNKGLEVIEARWLFDVAPEQISVVVHPQSIVHSLVEYMTARWSPSWAFRTCASP